MDEKMDLRIQKTYMALHNAFVSLLEEIRFEDLTVNELCQRAMIRRTTFYKHFADKYEYFTFCIRELMDDFHKRSPHDIGEETTEAYLTHMCRESIRFIREHNRFVRNIKSSSVFPILLDIMVEQASQDLVRALQRNNVHMSKAQLEGIAAFYAGGIANALFRYLKEDFSIDEEQFVQIIPRFSLEK